MANKRIPELILKSSLNGDIRFAIYDPSTDTTNQTRLSDFLPEAAPDSFNWDSAETYVEDDIVVFEDQVWISQANGNIDNPPFDGSAFWSIGVKGINGIVPWEAGIFTAETVLKLYEVETDVWVFAYLVSAVRPYNSTDIVAEKTAGDWVYIGESSEDPEVLRNKGDWTDATKYPDPTDLTYSVKENMYWTVNTGSGVSLNGEFWPDGTWLVAKINTPGQADANWQRRA